MGTVKSVWHNEWGFKYWRQTGINEQNKKNRISDERHRDHKTYNKKNLAQVIAMVRYPTLWYTGLHYVTTSPPQCRNVNLHQRKTPPIQIGWCFNKNGLHCRFSLSFTVMVYHPSRPWMESQLLCPYHDGDVDNFGLWTPLIFIVSILCWSSRQRHKKCTRGGMEMCCL